MVCHAHCSGERSGSAGTDGAHGGSPPLDKAADPEETETLPGKRPSVPECGRSVSRLHFRGDGASEGTFGSAGAIP